jgi:hypothetical protein
VSNSLKEAPKPRPVPCPPRPPLIQLPKVSWPEALKQEDRGSFRGCPSRVCGPSSPPQTEDMGTKTTLGDVDGNHPIQPLVCT